MACPETCEFPDFDPMGDYDMHADWHGMYGIEVAPGWRCTQEFGAHEDHTDCQETYDNMNPTAPFVVIGSFIYDD